MKKLVAAALLTLPLLCTGCVVASGPYYPGSAYGYIGPDVPTLAPWGAFSYPYAPLFGVWPYGVRGGYGWGHGYHGYHGYAPHGWAHGWNHNWNHGSGHYGHH